jgi:DNA-binding MarR family transcriptional regulator
MADVKTAEPRPLASPLYLRDEELKQGVDLLFAAFSDVFAQGEAALRDAGLGRAHRRALYFIARRPGLSVAQLLSILKITKQSLSRVLNDLRLTEKGAALEARLWAAQRPRVVRAFRDAGPEAVAGFRRVLTALSGEVQKSKDGGP